MSREQSRAMAEGVWIGVVAGVLFGVVEMAGAVVMGHSPFMPVRMFASVLLGEGAIDQTPFMSTMLVGAITHLVLSCAFGLVYGILNGALSRETRAGLGRQIGLGLAYGLALWLVNFHVIARAFYPWFLDSPQLLQAMSHTLFFGLPLGLLFGASERRVSRHAPPTAVPT